MMRLPTPRQPAPELSVETLEHGRFALSDRTPGTFTMLVFYRGLHCPVCRGYLQELAQHLAAFGERGVDVLAVSGDDADRAGRTQDEWDVAGLPIGFGLSEEAMDDWGLYVSAAIKDGEPARFNEPGLFLVDANGAIFYVAVNSMPFGRPKLADMLDAVDFVTSQDYPARGEVAAGGPAVAAG